jgi:hypothetical protein
LLIDGKACQAIDLLLYVFIYHALRCDFRHLLLR